MDEAPTVYTKVKGIQYRGIEAFYIIYDLLAGDPVVVEREPENVHDSSAVRIMGFSQGEDLVHIGYVEKEKSPQLALWMDRGWIYTAKVSAAAVVNRNAIRLNTLEVKCTPVKPLSSKATRKVHENV